MAATSGPYTLPELPYDYAALEPHCSGRIMELHHDKHHATYVKGANDTLDKLAGLRAGDEDTSARMSSLQRTLAFNVAGHLLHSVFWKNLSPDGGGKPEGELSAAIDDSFGDFESFKKEMSAAVTTVQGSGWGALVWEPAARRVLVTQVHDHQAQLTPASLPLLVIDAWEHAFYLQYENRKNEWVDAVWEMVNWPDVSARFAEATQAALPT
jgi:superoxide dismutase, Fe-Mn family